MTGHSSEIPTLVFRVVDHRELQSPAAVGDRVAESFGFNNGKNWEGTAGEGKDGQQEGRYLRWLQPMESELARQVEYDMDEQDKSWLDAVNVDRRRDGQAVVSYETFEIIMDKLEKEWFDLTKSIPKKTNAMPNEDSKCAICDDGECENSNAIVFCDGCNLAVHQDCYGVPYIPEGQWLCRKCTVSPDRPVSCVLCPNSYGAFKQTTTAQWAHLLCAIWIPDTGVSNTVYMEPIDGVENISKNRWKLVCYLCKKRIGACIQCANRSCFTAFHVTCAREYGLELKMKQGGERGELKAYCDKHSENFVALNGIPLSTASSQKRSHKKLEPFRHQPGQRLILKHAASNTNKSNKSARAYKQSYSFGPPLVPAFVFDRVVEYITKIKMAKKPAFVALVCRYWSLRREARRGAPLLKRLHLEPWTASATSRQQTDVEKAKKLELTRLLRNDLEKVRMLTEQVRKREKKKLERVQTFQNLIGEYIFSRDKTLRVALDKIAAFDKQHIFAQPVSRLLVPDYYDIIKCPMDWATMGEKLDRHEYLTATDFQDDVELVVNNARLYNKRETHVHKSAVKLLESAEPILTELEALDTLAATKHAADLALLLTPEYLEDLFTYTCDLPPPKPKTPKAARPKPKGRVSELMEGSDAKRSHSRKRSADVAGLGEGGSARKPAQPRLRGVLAELGEAIDLSPVISSRVNARDAARLRAELSEAAAPGPSTLAKLDGGKLLPAVQEHQAAPTVSALADHDTFSLFESGWVLPEGSSRRKPIVPFAPPNKSALTSRPKTAAGQPIESPALKEVARARAAATAAQDPPRSQKSRKGKEKEVLEDAEMQDAEGSGSADAGGEGKANGAGGSPKKVVSRSRLLDDWREKVKAREGPLMVDENTKFEDGDMVWARLPSYPFYPAEYTPVDHEKVTKAILKNRPADPDVVLVFFFDDARSTGWITRSNLRLMAEDMVYDQLLLEEWSFPNARSRKPDKDKVEDRRHDYEFAIENIEIESDLVEASNGTKGGDESKKKKKRKR